MAWENSKVEHQRLQLITAYMKKEASMTDLCRRFGVSRKTGYKWYEVFLKEGKNGLKDMSRAPHVPHTVYNSDLIDIAIDLKLKRRSWGPKKILVKLYELYPRVKWPSPTRLYDIFKELNLVTSRKLRHRVPQTSPLGDLEGCNDTWSVDFKGWFLTGDGNRCEPLTVADCHSRFLIKCIHLDKHSVDYVWPVFEEAFFEYGLPHRVRSDNGPPFGSVGAGRLTGLSVKLIKAGVIPEWIEPGHPEQNGRHERFHLTLKQDIANPPKESLALQLKAMTQFQEEYNYDRPHEALGMKTPASCYSKSPRTWNGQLKSPEYNMSIEVRKVCQSGCLWLKGKEYYIGKTLEGEYVGLKSNELDELEVYYGPVYLGKLDLNTGLEKPQRKTRKRR